MLRFAVIAVFCVQSLRVHAQAPLPQAHLPPLRHVDGVDAGTQTQFTLLAVPAERDDATLIVQCTALPNHTQHFELFLSLVGTPELVFREHHKRLITEPLPVYTTVTLDFRGYTHVKPFRREFEVLSSGDLRYNPPGIQSHNLEEASWFLQYLRSLPELIVTETARAPAAPRTATFATEQLLAQLRGEPLCKASGL